MDNKETRESIIYPLTQMPVLTKKQLVAYATKRTGFNATQILNEIRRLKQQQEIIEDENNISMFSVNNIKRKDVIAFWVLLAFSDQTGEKFRKSNWPSSIVFYDERFGKVARITVCDNESYDPDMVGMLDTHDDNHIEIIAGCDMDLEEINPSMIPPYEFIYAKVCGSPMMEVPEVSMKKIKGKDAQKE